MTSSMPMPAASRPALQVLGAERRRVIVWPALLEGQRQRAVARAGWPAASACAAVKLPVICESPVSTPWISGAETTSLSSTTATRQLPSCRARRCAQVWPLLLEGLAGQRGPLVLAVAVEVEADHPLAGCWSSCAVASATSVPEHLATSSRYLSCRSRQATACCVGRRWIEPAGRLSSCSQVICRHVELHLRRQHRDLVGGQLAEQLERLGLRPGRSRSAAAAPLGRAQRPGRPSPPRPRGRFASAGTGRRGRAAGARGGAAPARRRGALGVARRGRRRPAAVAGAVGRGRRVGGLAASAVAERRRGVGLGGGRRDRRAAVRRSR